MAMLGQMPAEFATLAVIVTMALLLAERYGVEIAQAVFVDDSARNVETALALGFDSVRFESPAQLRAELARRGLLAPIE